MTGQVYVVVEQRALVDEARRAGAEAARHSYDERADRRAMEGSRQYVVNQQAKLIQQQEAIRKLSEENARIAEAVGKALRQAKGGP